VDANLTAGIRFGDHSEPEEEEEEEGEEGRQYQPGSSPSSQDEVLPMATASKCVVFAISVWYKACNGALL